MKTVVVGAGVFGAWTAHHLQAAGHEVHLIDAFGAAHSRSSSGGESRLTRAAYGQDAIYTRMAVDSLSQWKELSSASDQPIFIPSGVLFFFPAEQEYFRDTVATHRELGLPTEILDAREMSRRFPMMDFDGISVGLLEPGFGALMARRAVSILVDRFVRAGGVFSIARAIAPSTQTSNLSEIRLSSGEAVAADLFVFAVGAWLPTIFPDVIGPRIRPTRQEIFFFAPPAGDPRFRSDSMPAWADFNDGDMFYGFPDLESRGVKFAHDVHGPPADPDSLDRRPTNEALAEIIDFRDRRFPLLKGAPLTEARVCQYENSSNGDFLIDFHPRIDNLLLVGGGSGHGFKHGPEVGRYAARRLVETVESEPRFSLDAKAEIHNREVY